VLLMRFARLCGPLAAGPDRARVGGEAQRGDHSGAKAAQAARSGGLAAQPASPGGWRLPQGLRQNKSAGEVVPQPAAAWHVASGNTAHVASGDHSGAAACAVRSGLSGQQEVFVTRNYDAHSASRGVDEGKTLHAATAASGDGGSIQHGVKYGSSQKVRLPRHPTRACRMT